MIRRARFMLETATFGSLLRLARVMPRRVLQAAGATAGTLGYVLDRRHARIGIDNLRRSLPDVLDRAASRRIAHRCWRHFGRITFDTFAFPGLTADDIGRGIELEGVEHVRAAYERGRGVLVFSGHFGHWELAALMQGHLGMPLSLVARRLDNPGLERLLASMRTGSGNTIIHKHNAVREMLRTLQQGGGIAIVIDQDARDSGVFVPFFGRLASTTPTLATLALRTGAAVVPVFAVALGGGRYRIVYERAVPVESTGDRDADVVRLTADCTAIIERWVRRHPEQWLWMHRRWKTPPPS